MARFSILSLGLFALSALGLVMPAAAENSPADSGESTPAVRIGMVKTLFTDIPQPLVKILLHPFGTLMREFTGVNGEVELGGDPLEVARDLQEGKIDLAVFHGVEYAWAKQRYPKLKPLMVAVTKYDYAQAHLIVRADSNAKSWADLKGKKIGYPLRSREHSRLFMSRYCFENGQCDPAEYFKLSASANMEKALDNVCTGVIDATIVDNIALENYRDIKPGCFARLKSLHDSERFPTGAIVYRDGKLDSSIVQRFQNGLVDATKTARGRDMLRMFRITSFEHPPENYQQSLADIIKLYPAPENATSAVSIMK